jgi:hypothetical protein
MAKARCVEAKALFFAVAKQRLCPKPGIIGFTRKPTGRQMIDQEERVGVPFLPTSEAGDRTVSMFGGELDILQLLRGCARFQRQVADGKALVFSLGIHVEIGRSTANVIPLLHPELLLDLHPVKLAITQKDDGFVWLEVGVQVLDQAHLDLFGGMSFAARLDMPDERQAALVIG